MALKQFQKTIWEFYQKNKRDLPWREVSDGTSLIDPYKILISEIMLQQTQVKRVIPKYQEFIQKFPTFESLAKSSNREVLELWLGLGYNRRALFLKKTAEQVYEKYNSTLPSQFDELIQLPGIGKNTAGSLLAFAYNKPVVFIETNIRTVFIHFFFENRQEVDDKEIILLIEKSLDYKNPREWYYALMDYGAYLKSITKNKAAKQSKHYVVQSKFKGSNRELRGKVIRYFLKNQHASFSQLKIVFEKDLFRLKACLKDLLKEGFLTKTNDFYKLVR